LKECVGSQDQVACSYGGFNLIKFRQDNSFKIISLDKHYLFKKKLNENLVLLFTGKQRTAERIAQRFVKKINSAKKQEINDILSLVKIAKDLVH
jgi:galactokinase/mevalonate kinase-like predicted kinase